MEEYRVSLSRFEGPLDLLLPLIEKAEISIEEIFVSEITAQYMAYMEDLSEQDMDRASAFLTVAAQLLLIKSRSLLPRQALPGDEEEDPKQQLIEQLRAYKAFKQVSAALSERFEETKGSFSRLPEEIPLPPQKVDFSNATLNNLIDAFWNVLNRDSGKTEKEPIVRRVTRDSFTVRDRVQHLRNRLAQGRVAFEDLFSDDAGRMEKVVTFMALLEMLAHGEVRITQGATFAPIFIRPKDLRADDGDYTYMDEVED